MSTIMEQVNQAAAAVGDAFTTATDAVKSQLPFPPEGQNIQPGLESEMWVKPEYIRESYRGSGKLTNKVALITGGDSGIGRAVAVHFAREGADVFIVYLNEEEDAKETIRLVQAENRKAGSLMGDIGNKKVCEEAISRCISEMGKLDILINNAAVQHYRSSILDITDDTLEETFRVNNLAMFYLTRAALKHLPWGGAIINTASVTAYAGEPNLLDYSASKGAIVSFTRALANQLIPKGIRVNGVAPGPIWTPLIPATFPRATIPAWQKSVPMQRAGQPSEVAPAYVFLASEDGSYFTGQVLHPNGGKPVNG